MQKWEYKKIWRQMDLSGIDPISLGTGSGPSYKWKDTFYEDNDPKQFRDEMHRLKDLGQEGWELVSILYEHEGGLHTYTYYLKRAID